MKKFLFFFTIFSTSLFSQTLEEIAINDVSKISLPNNVQIIDTLNLTVFNASDNAGIYNVKVGDLPSEITPPSEEIQLKEIYDKIIGITITSSNGKLITKKEILIDSLKGVEVEYHSDKDPSFPKIRYKRILYCNGILYTFEFLTSESIKEAAQYNKDKFFNSFNINSSEQYYNTAPNQSAYELGYNFGYIIGYVFVPLIVIILIVVGIYSVYKRQNK